MSLIKVRGIKCPNCLEELWSKYTHDFHWCKCGDCFVDGGRDYLRYGWKDIQPEVIDLEVERKP